jgi:formyltetrahydrofolate synthetase
MFFPCELTLFVVVAFLVRAGDGATYSEQAEKKLATYEKQGFGNLPICMSKTHLSLR